MSWKVAALGLVLTAATLPACPFRKKDDGGTGDPSTPGTKASASAGLIKPSGPVVMATGHPRLFVREVDIPRLRTWAKSDNPIFEKGLKVLVEQCAEAMDGSSFLSDDPGSATGYAEKPIEAYAMLFAFYSLVSNSEAERAAYAKRARTLLMHVIGKAAKGPAADQPFRDPRFSINNRSRWSGMGFPLTVDWIYSTLTAADKKTIRNVFLRWAAENQVADTTTWNHPEPLGVTNDPRLVADVQHVRWSANNFYCAHARNLGLMAMSFDAADDPEEKLRSQLSSVTGAWLYVNDHLMRGDMRGGLAAEGFEYSQLSLGYISQLLLALYTAGRADPKFGKQVTFDNNPFWDDAIPGFLHSLSPIAKTTTDQNKAYLGALHDVAWYGDGEAYWAPDFVGVFGPLGIYDQYTQNTKRNATLRWIETNYAPGGAERLTDRAADNNDLLGAIFYFMLFDPKAAPPPDPRPQYPLHHFAEGLGRFLQRTSWKEDATWFSYKLGWTSVDHQMADGNMFELWRKGEWLTKERTGYGDDAACTDQKNGISLQNDKPFHDGADRYSGVEWRRGSQWTYVNNGDGKILASRIGPDFTYFLGDALALQNSKEENSQDIVYVNRSIVWLVPDRIVTYDRAASKKEKRFKRLTMQLPARGNVAGNLMTMKSAGGQNLFVRTLLPNPASIVVEPAEKLDDDRGKQPADLDPIRFRFRVEAPGSPKSVRWLEVIQGADGGSRADDASLITATGSTPYQGAAFNNTVVMFPVDLGTFKDISYTAPASTKAHLVTGLTPNAGYRVTTKKGGAEDTITVTSGGDQKADRGGVLMIGKLAP
jgi:hypothetical protein